MMCQQRDRDKVVAIEIVFENVEVLRFDIGAFERVDIRDVRKHYYGGAVGYAELRDLYEVLTNKDLYSDAHTECRPFYLAHGHVWLCIKKEANDTTKYRPSMCEDLTPFQRLKCSPDVTALALIYSDGTTQSIWVPFDGEEESSLQSTYEDEAGNLCLHIRPCPPEREKNVPVWGRKRIAHVDDEYLSHAIASIKGGLYNLPTKDVPDAWYAQCAFIHDDLRRINRRIGKVQFYSSDSWEEAEARYQRLRKKVSATMEAWEKKSAPVLAKWKGKKRNRPVRAIYEMECVSRGLAQILHLIEDEFVLKGLRRGT